MSERRDLWRSALCDHGPRCRLRRRGICGFAHGLQELRPPDEQYRLYNGVWRDGADRWYGQHMSSRQLHRIAMYWNASAPWERPAWACGLHWLTNNLAATAYPEHPWEFNLWADWDVVCRGRKERVVLFHWMRSGDGLDLWDAFASRWEAFHEASVRGALFSERVWGISQYVSTTSGAPDGMCSRLRCVQCLELCDDDARPCDLCQQCLCAWCIDEHEWRLCDGADAVEFTVGAGKYYAASPPPCGDDLYRFS